MRSHARETLGVTLVELMIVVVIIGILAAISTVGYRKYVARARTTEATAMLAEFAAKEQLYFLDNGEYLLAHRSGNELNEDADQFWPSDPGVAPFDSARTPVSASNMPDSWRVLGIRPRWNSLYCTYLANAGAANVAPPGTLGVTLWSATPAVPWFYGIAACNLGGRPGWPNVGADNFVTVMILTHDSPAIRTIDENQ